MDLIKSFNSQSTLVLLQGIQSTDEVIFHKASSATVLLFRSGALQVTELIGNSFLSALETIVASGTRFNRVWQALLDYCKIFSQKIDRRIMVGSLTSFC